MDDETNASRLTRLARLMGYLSGIGAVLAPLTVAAIFLLPVWLSSIGSEMRWNTLTAGTIAAAPFAYRLAAFVLALVPAAFTVWAMWSLKRLFLLYARGEVFSAVALRMLNHVAVALFASVVTSLAMQGPVTLLLSWAKGPGHRTISFGLGNHDIGTLFLAGAVLVIARVMAEARRMADENASFV